MFTGIITHTGTIKSATPSRIVVRAPRGMVGKLRRGASIAVDGACLTVTDKTEGTFTADIMEETARVTTLGSLRSGAVMNLELPATPMSFLAGHIVQGHVDGIGIVKKITNAGNSHVLAIAIPKTVVRCVVPKGSIAINGVSLTVMSVRGSVVEIGIIPHTGDVTNLYALVVGSRVNIEVDILAKYVQRLIMHP